jgi:predicted kinase
MKEYRFPYYNELTDDVNWTELDKYDWIQDMKSTIQDKVYHQEGNVYNHTKMVVNELFKQEEFQKLSIQEKHILVITAIFHDIEKRSTTVIEEDGRVTSKGHGIKGGKTTNYILYKDFNVPFNIRYEIVQLIKYHSKALWWETAKDSNHYVIKLSLLLNNKYLVILSTADVNGRIAGDTSRQLETIEFFKELCIENECYDKTKTFKSNLSRNYYIKNGGYPEIEVFDDTKSNVKILCGIAGSGKDTHIRDLKNFEVISLDDIRKEFKSKIGDKKSAGRVIQEAKSRAKEYLRNNIDFIWNATNLTRNNRQQLINIFSPYKPYIEIIYIEKDYNTLIKQNKERVESDLVPLDVIDNMIKKLELPELIETFDLKTYIN